MYGLTDNIVAGPAGHTTAGPAGHFEAGGSGTFTAAPAGHVQVEGGGHVQPSPGGTFQVEGGGHVPISEGGTFQVEGGGHVPIDTSLPNIPYRAPSGGMLYSEGSTLGAIPGPSAHVPVTPATGPTNVTIGGGGGVGGGGGGSVGGGGGGGVSGGGLIGSSGTGGGGGGGIGAGVSGGGGAFGNVGGMSYVTHHGQAMPPVELRVGQATSPATTSPPFSPATEGFTVSPGGRLVPTPTGYVHPPRASHFHGNPMTHVAHHPTQVYNHTTTTEAWQGYHASYVWAGRPEGTPPPPFLAADYVKPSPYSPPHVVFSDEKPGPKITEDASIGAKPAPIAETNNITINQDYSQPRAVEYSTSNATEKNVTLDNSEQRSVAVNMPQTDVRQTDIDMSSTRSVDMSTVQLNSSAVALQEGARITNLLFSENDPGLPAALSMGGPIVGKKA